MRKASFTISSASIDHLITVLQKHSKALELVVELHKSQDITLPDGDWGMNCVECDGFRYPCRTMQIIYKELF